MKKVVLLLTAVVLACSPSFAQKKKNKKGKKDAQTAPLPQKNPNEKPSISSKTKSAVKMEGLFTLFKDTSNGKLYLLIKKEQLGKEYIHFTYTENGVLAAGHNRGQYRGSRIIKLKKYYDNIEIEQQNTSFYFDSTSELSKAANANITHSILASEKIVAADEAKGEYLIDADELLMSEKLHQIKSPTVPGPMAMFTFNLGMLSRSKTKYNNIRNYPKNTDIVISYVYDNPSPIVGGGAEVADDRYVEVQLQHSFIEVPDNQFQPRFEDPRLGYFTDEVNDMTTPKAINYRDPIHRWNLVKKDPSAAKSEPVQPIVWWIENTTPKEYRQTIKNAALEWNKAFEPLGFINAVQIFEQPDTASWDAGDIRYNVLRWTSSPNPPFGGYGPSFVNPRTGEILGADIMLEYIFVTNRLIREKLFQTQGFEALDIPQLHENEHQNHFCSASEELHLQSILGMTMLKAANADESELSELIKQSLHYLILHEMGHTLGLMHNMKASQLRSPEELKNAELTKNSGLIGSVMDYPAINLNGEIGANLQYCQTSPGPYDMWVIEYGYSIGTDDPIAERKRLNAIASRSAEPQLAFGNDADDMRAPGKAIDPRVMINDLSSDAIAYSTERVIQVQKLLETIRQRYPENGASYQELKNVVGVLSGEYMTSVGIISRYVGGVYVERTFNGQPGAKQPYTAVPYETQKRAMNALADLAFAPGAMNLPGELPAYLQAQRRGFNFFFSSEDPKIHERTETMQQSVMAHLLSKSVLARLTDSRLYGNTYSVNEMMTDLTKAVFDADLNGSVNTFRQNLQINYVEKLIFIAGLKEGTVSFYDNISKSVAFTQLIDIRKKLKAAVGGNKETQDHRAYILQLIENGTDD